MREVPMSIRETIALELRVALSRTAQPVWFRVVKWMLIVSAAFYFWRAPQFWWSVAGLFGLAGAYISSGARRPDGGRGRGVAGTMLLQSGVPPGTLINRDQSDAIDAIDIRGIWHVRRRREIVD